MNNEREISLTSVSAMVWPQRTVVSLMNSGCVQKINGGRDDACSALRNSCVCDGGS